MKNPLVQFIGALLLIGAVLAAAAYFLPYRLYQAIGASAEYIRTARTRIAFLEYASERAKANEAALASNKALLREIQSAFFDEKNPLLLIEVIEGLAKAAGVHLDIDLAGAAERPPTFRLTVMGGIGEALAFLKFLENAPVVVTVHTMTFDVIESPKNLPLVQGKPPEASLILLVSGLIAK